MGTSKNSIYLAHVIASGAKQSRGKGHNVNSNSGLLRFARNDVSEFLHDVSEFLEIPLFISHSVQIKMEYG